MKKCRNAFILFLHLPYVDSVVKSFMKFKGYLKMLKFKQYITANNAGLTHYNTIICV